MNKTGSKILFGTLILCILLSVLIFVRAEDLPGTGPLLETPSQAETESLTTPTISQDQYLINPETYYYPSLNNPSNFVTWSDEYCNKTADMDFIVEMAPDACQPSPVTSDLLEEQNVPVMCKMTGIKINPLIDVPSIKKVTPFFKNQSKEIAYINFYPAKSALGNYQFNSMSIAGQGNPTLSNLGYVVVSLRQQPVESKMPNNVSVKVILNITYDVSKTYGLHTEQFSLPVMTQGEWEQGYKKYSFGNGKGYVRLREIKENNAKVEVYYNAFSSPIASKEMREGDSLSFKLPGFYCQEGLNITLDEITVPGIRARLVVNGDEFLVEQGEEIADSGCYIQNIELENYGYGGKVQISCQGAVHGSTGGGYELSLAPKNAALEIKDNIPTRGSISEKQVTLGDEIQLNVTSNDEYKLEYYYIAHIGKAAVSGKTAKDVVIVFSSITRAQLADETVRKYVQAFQQYLTSSNREEIESDTSLKNTINKNPQVNGQIGSVVKIDKGTTRELGGQFNTASIRVLSVEGPKQVTYSKSVEEAYKSAISQYRSISSEFPNQKDLVEFNYGIKALRKAQELAHFMSKEDDEINFLQEIIDKYQESQDEDIKYQVESARDDIVSLSQGSGNKFTTISSEAGTFYITLISIERPGYSSQEATLKVNGTEGEYLLGSQVGDWAISEINDNSVKLISSEKEEPISRGSFRFLGPTKVQLISTYIKKEAKVTFWPFEKERTTTTNFSVTIGIEKRAIQLTPEQIQKKIKGLNKTIETLNKYVNALEKVTSAWKKACYVGGSVLWAKSLLEGLSGTSIARGIVMKAWTVKCASEEYRTQLGNNKLITVSQCYLKNNASINKDVESVKSIVNEANDFVKSIKAKSGVVTSSGLLGLSKSINDEKFLLEAKSMFLTDAKAKQLIEDVKVSVTVSRLSAQQKGRIIKLLNLPETDPDKLTEEETRGTCNSPGSVQEILGIQEGSPKYTREIKNCILNVPVHVDYVINNLDKLADQGLVSVDDIKELYLILAINKKSGISQVFQDYNDISIFSKFDGFEATLLKKENRNSLSGALGIRVLSYDEEKIKPLTATSIATLDENIINKFNTNDGDPSIARPSSQQIILDNGYYTNTEGGKSYIVYETNTREIFAVLEPVGNGEYTYKAAYQVSIDTGAGIITILDNQGDEKDPGSREKGLSQTLMDKLPRIKEQDIGKCGHEMAKEDYVIKFWESGVYEGLIAYMPITRNEGWYYATKAYSGLENKLVSYKETGQPNEYWICNVGENGKAEFNFYSGAEGDDGCCIEISKTTGMTVPDEYKEIVDKLERSGGCLQKALDSYKKKENPINAGACGKPSRGKPPVNIPSTQCEEFMSPDECSLMYNLCDPVICPPSRCDFGGRFPVENVIQTGIVGSLILCSSNTDVAVPICITGLYNGLDSLNNMVFKQYKDCLQKQIDTGQTTGICDYWHSVYFCQLLWNNLDPFIKAGIPLVTESLSSGGGEYALFSDTFKRSQDSLTYFTQNYGPNAFMSFKERSVNESGTSICDRYLSIRYPTVAKFFDDLTKADSYYQLYASVDEIPMGQGSPESQYRVFYTIYAGRDQSLTYQVYLKKKVTSQTYSYELEKQPVRDGVGFLAVGQTISKKVDFTAPSGYNEICISINGKDNCGFATLSTSFAVQELQNVYLQDQIKKNIKTQKECQAGSATIIPTASFNLQGQIQESLQPEIYRRGIVRVCASNNPGGSTDSTRYQRIGYCDNEKIGCWLDMNSVNDSISDLGIVKDVYNYSEQKTIEYMLKKEGYDPQETSQDKLLEAEQEMESIEKQANDLIDTINARFSSDNPALIEKSSESEKSSVTGSAIAEENAGVYDPNLVGPVRMEDIKVPSNINREEVQKILNDYGPEIVNITNRIDSLVKKLEAISEKCISIEEKSRAEWDIALMLDLKTRLKSQVEVALTNLAVIQEGSCAGQGGDWYPLVACPQGYTKIGDANDEQDHPGHICCSQIMGKFEEFTEWYTDSKIIIGQNEKTHALILGKNLAKSPGTGRVTKADNGLKVAGIGNREYIIKYTDNLFIKYTVSGHVEIKPEVSKGAALNPGRTLFNMLASSKDFFGANNVFVGREDGGQVTVIAYVNSERDLRNPLCFFTTEIMDDIKEANKGNSKIKVPSEDECKGEREGIEVNGIEYGVTPGTGVQINDEFCQQKVVEIAKSALGCDYSLGAPVLDSSKTPNCVTEPKTAFDCSSFTQWVFNHYIDTYSAQIEKISDRTATQQAIKVGTQVSNAIGKDAIYEQDKLQPGDLLFFRGAEPPDPTYDIGHAAIYIGDGKIIHAPGASKGVVISDINDYYKGKYRGAKRVCTQTTSGIITGQDLGSVRPTFYYTANGDLSKYDTSSKLNLYDSSGAILKTIGSNFIDAVRMEGAGTFTSNSGKKIVFSYSSLKQVSGGYQITPLNVEYGVGAKGILAPYKTIAINPLNHLSGEDLAYDEVYYIPALSGCSLPDGTKHNGLVIARDTGSAFYGADKPADRIDIYIGIESDTNNVNNPLTRCGVKTFGPIEIQKISATVKNEFYAANNMGSSSSSSSSSSSQIEVLLYSNRNNGKFDSSNDNNLVSYSDSVKVCAVMSQDGKLYSSSEVSSKNPEISTWSGTTPSFEWYKIQAYQSPSYSGATSTYSLPAAGVGTKDDIIQYRQVKVSSDSWCIDQKSIDSSPGTYWYRAKVTIGALSASSLGEPAASSDTSALQSKLPLAKISKYTGNIGTLLKPDSMENYAISPSVMRVSRKSNYDTTICRSYGYLSSDKRCQFISTLEAFKNLPFVHGCGEYNCGEIAEPGTSCSTNPVSHLAENFIAVDCLNLMISALEQTTGKTYNAFNDFNKFISDYGAIKNNIDKRLMTKILDTEFNFGKDEQVEVGDLLFMYSDNYYFHTFVIYKDENSDGKFNGEDYAVYASNTCPGSNPLDPSSRSAYSGNLCYTPFARYATPEGASLRYTLVQIKDLG